MDIPDAERIKHREIAFQDIHPNPHQALTAARFLADRDGILHIDPASPALLRIRYDVLITTLREIEEALSELGLHLDTRLFHKLMRALHDYTEETFRANCGGHSGDINVTEKLFAKQNHAVHPPRRPRNRLASPPRLSLRRQCPS
ncbi:hypothetical protein [uncultured Thiocystis sp.]|jgi:hypothetical protein|uniref:hypothetical protein n=1 Tax=uncultured Thiocystis sp. TaxID=1202134 RepID=UPI0025F7207E|nr:hypothetical protein [uncultured Thiocystis sp.]